MSATEPHRWRFFRAGGVDQVRLDTGADLFALDSLDPKLWAALACPIDNIEFDRRTLQLMDGDGDGRIRLSDVQALAKWLRPRLKKPDDLLGGASELPLSAIREDTPEGAAVLESARSALETMNRLEATAITIDEATAAVEAFKKRPLNGDGVVLPTATEDTEARALLTAVLDSVGGTPDLSGASGVNSERLAAFFAEAEAYLVWVVEGEKNPALRPLGEATGAAWGRLSAIAPRVDDYFARVRLAAFDPRATAPLNPDEKAYAALSAQILSLDVKEGAAFPLAQIVPGRPLPLESGLNPAFEEAVAALRTEVLLPLLGERTELTEAEWRRIRALFAPYEAWQANKRGAKVEGLGADRVRALIASDARPKIEALIRQDLALEPVFRCLEDVERLARLRRDFLRFCRNFVNFREFYAQEERAIFQAGTLYLDQRSCDLCLKVENPSAHALMAGLSRSYLAYCDCTRKNTGEKMTIVAAFTSGDSDNLMVGRNGVFHDRQGLEWDATITRIVDNPISIRQAFFSPYKKLVRFIEEQVLKRAAAAEQAGQTRLAGSVTEIGEAADTGKAKPRPGFDVGVVAALGVAVGGLTAAMGALLQAFFGLGLWMPLGFLGLLAAISGPSMLIAWIKLRVRNVGPLLDANGWAVNVMARINVRFGGALTRRAILPEGAVRDLRDPFPDKHYPWRLYLALGVLVVLALVWLAGNFDPWLPDALQAKNAFQWPQAEPVTPTPTP